MGPRLNAAGRLTDMQLGIECLLCDDLKQALEYATALQELNQERRAIENQMQEQAMSVLDGIVLDGELPYGLCLYDENWHQGVIGILASRLKELYQRPVIALALSEAGIAKGSARSIPEIHIRDLLADINSRYPNMLLRYGGHAMAAGLTLNLSMLSAFQKVFEATVYQYLDGTLPGAEIVTDGCLHKSEMNIDMARLLRYAGPWGQGFPPPLFEGRFRIVSQYLVGKVHLKLKLEMESEYKTNQYSNIASIDAIAFHWGESLVESEWIYIVYQLDVNEYMGQETPQLIVEHLQPI